jgi:hypothetical protein
LVHLTHFNQHEPSSHDDSQIDKNRRKQSVVIDPVHGVLVDPDDFVDTERVHKNEADSPDKRNNSCPALRPHSLGSKVNSHVNLHYKKQKAEYNAPSQVARVNPW